MYTWLSNTITAEIKMKKYEYKCKRYISNVPGDRCEDNLEHL